LGQLGSQPGIQAGPIHRPDDAVEVGVETLSRLEADRKCRLGIGERITREVLHEGHRN
jgi:hypothetical protein